MTSRMMPLVALLLASLAAAQEPVATPEPADRGTISVFLDCQSFEACDSDFHRTELAVVNWVRDRQVADVHLLVTTQGTGAGGTEYSVNFIGLRRFAGMVDTLRYVSQPAETGDAKRRGLARVFRLGLVRYIARTPGASQIGINMTESAGASTQTRPEHDRWRAWVFRTSMNVNADGEKSFQGSRLRGTLEANRITEQWKTRIFANEFYSESSFEIDDSTTVTNLQRSYGGSLLHAKSLGQHWSAGLRMDINSSTYDNFRRRLSVFPAVEYNVFPYAESTRRQLRLEYNVGYSRFNYRDTTIHDKIREGKPLQRLRVSTAATQPWGSTDFGIEAINYLDDRSLYRIGTGGELSLRLFRGFNLNFFGSYDIIEDQFFLPKKNFTPEEILTRQFQQATTYRYWFGAGLSYTFGSIYNNVVNPRF